MQYPFRMLSSRLGGHGAISRSEPNTASTTEVRLATNDCCYWTSAHNGRLREVRHKPAGQPVLPSHPTPLHPFPLLGPSIHLTDHSADGCRRAISWVPGVLY